MANYQYFAANLIFLASSYMENEPLKHDTQKLAHLGVLVRSPQAQEISGQYFCGE